MPRLVNLDSPSYMNLIDKLEHGKMHICFLASCVFSSLVSSIFPAARGVGESSRTI